MKLSNPVRIGYLFLALLMLFVQSCGVYSFTGTNLPPDVETITVQNFYNDSGGGPPNLMQLFTEGLKDYYQRNTRLAMVNEGGHLQVEGSIIGWDLAPVAPQASNTAVGGDLAAQQRLTIAVKVNYINLKDETQNFEKTFSYFADYNPDQTTLQAEESRLIDEIFERIIFDIFNSTVANW